MGQPGGRHAGRSQAHGHAPQPAKSFWLQLVGLTRGHGRLRGVGGGRRGRRAFERAASERERGRLSRRRVREPYTVQRVLSASMTSRATGPAKAIEVGLDAKAPSRLRLHLATASRRYSPGEGDRRGTP